MIFPTEQFWEDFKNTNGAFSTPEALALMNITKDAPTNGVWAEFGSYKGKSAISAAYPLESKKEFVLVDPEFKDSDFAEEVIRLTRKYFDPLLISDYSTNIIPRFHNYAYAFIDSGDHGEELVSSEVLAIEDRVMSGGIIAFHDLDNQFTAVRRWYDYLLGTGKYAEIPINWAQIFDYVRGRNLEEGNMSWHEKGSEEFPKFVGALKRK
jgi:hypothetical protein